MVGLTPWRTLWLKIPTAHYRPTKYYLQYLCKILQRDTPKTTSQKNSHIANKNGQQSLIFFESGDFLSTRKSYCENKHISINRETKFNIDQKIPKIDATRRWHMQLFFNCSYRVIVRVIQRRVTQNFMRKIRTILKTWSQSIPQTEPEISQNVSQQRKLFLLIGILLCKAEQPLRGMELHKESTKRLKYTGNMSRKNLQLKNVCKV